LASKVAFFKTMELILEFFVSPILSAIRATFEFVFWMICWAVWQIARGVRWVMFRDLQNGE
jgi:hypothetical protein